MLCGPAQFAENDVGKVADLAFRTPDDLRDLRIRARWFAIEAETHLHNGSLKFREGGEGGIAALAEHSGIHTEAGIDPFFVHRHRLFGL